MSRRHHNVLYDQESLTNQLRGRNVVPRTNIEIDDLTTFGRFCRLHRERQVGSSSYDVRTSRDHGELAWCSRCNADKVRNHAEWVRTIETNSTFSRRKDRFPKRDLTRHKEGSPEGRASVGNGNLVRTDPGRREGTKRQQIVIANSQYRRFDDVRGDFSPLLATRGPSIDITPSGVAAEPSATGKGCQRALPEERL